MARTLFALLLGVVVTGCASLGVRTEGVSGPIAWRATDLKVQAVGEAPGFIGVGRAAQEVYSFTLVLQETQGTAITFTKVAYTIDSGPALLPFSSEQPGHWELRPYRELRWPLSSSYHCPASDCMNPGAVAPVWHIILTGTDDKGRPVRAVIDLKLPYNPDAMQKR